MCVNRKACLMGSIVGIVAIVAGCVFLFLGVSYSSYSPGYGYYDDGYCAFGADFYTYVNNNAAGAASAVRGVGDSLETFGNIVSKGIGIALICFGGFIICLFCAINGKNDEGKTVKVNNISNSDIGGIKMRTVGVLNWVCPSCGVENANYIGTCGCGCSKP